MRYTWFALCCKVNRASSDPPRFARPIAWFRRLSSRQLSVGPCSCLSGYSCPRCKSTVLSLAFARPPEHLSWVSDVRGLVGSIPIITHLSLVCRSCHVVFAWVPFFPSFAFFPRTRQRVPLSTSTSHQVLPSRVDLLLLLRRHRFSRTCCAHPSCTWLVSFLRLPPLRWHVGLLFRFLNSIENTSTRGMEDRSKRTGIPFASQRIPFRSFLSNRVFNLVERVGSGNRFGTRPPPPFATQIRTRHGEVPQGKEEKGTRRTTKWRSGTANKEDGGRRRSNVTMRKIDTRFLNDNEGWRNTSTQRWKNDD